MGTIVLPVLRFHLETSWLFARQRDLKRFEKRGSCERMMMLMKDLCESSHEYCPSQIWLWAGHNLKIKGLYLVNIVFVCAVFVFAFIADMNCYV